MILDQIKGLLVKKYLLGINRRSCNSAAWGETGKLPLFIDSVSLCIKYFLRIINLDSSYLVKAALNEQIQLQLSWFKNIKNIIECFGEIEPAQYQRNSCELLNAMLMAQACSADVIVRNLEQTFKDTWTCKINSSEKMSFYAKIKKTFDGRATLTTPPTLTSGGQLRSLDAVHISYSSKQADTQK